MTEQEIDKLLDKAAIINRNPAKMAEIHRELADEGRYNIAQNYYLLLLCSPEIMAWDPPHKKTIQTLCVAGYSKKYARQITFYSQFFRIWPLCRDSQEECEKWQTHIRKFGLQTKIVYKDYTMKLKVPLEAYPRFPVPS